MSAARGPLPAHPGQTTTRSAGSDRLSARVTSCIRNVVRPRCHALGMPRTCICRRPGRAPGEAVLRGQPRATARPRHEGQHDAVPPAARRPVADVAARRLPDRERRAQPLAEGDGRAALRRAGQPHHRPDGPDAPQHPERIRRGHHRRAGADRPTAPQHRLRPAAPDGPDAGPGLVGSGRCGWPWCPGPWPIRSGSSPSCETSGPWSRTRSSWAGARSSQLAEELQDRAGQGLRDVPFSPRRGGRRHQVHGRGGPARPDPDGPAADAAVQPVAVRRRPLPRQARRVVAGRRSRRGGRFARLAPVPGGLGPHQAPPRPDGRGGRHRACTSPRASSAASRPRWRS